MAQGERKETAVTTGLGIMPGDRMLWAVLGIVLSVVLHVAPIWFVLFGPVYETPEILELDLEELHSFRERVFREMTVRGQQNADAMPMQLSVVLPVPAEPKIKVSRPRKEEELARARAIQRAIRHLWDSMSPTHPGSALVSLNILPDGSIGEYVVNRVSGDNDFRLFLASFLATMKRSYGNQGGGGDALWIECEFVVKPGKGVKRPS